MSPFAYLASAYVCDLAQTVPVPPDAFPSAGLTPAGIMHAAAVYISGPALKSTSYSYTSLEDGERMVFNTDCSCFLDYTARNYIPTAYAEVPPDDTVSPPVPRASSWTQFIASLSPTDTHWQRIDDVTEMEAGDVFAYELPPGSKDTGHVMIAINQTSGAGPVSPSVNPFPDQYAAAYWVYVADASSVLHQNDTRGPGKQFANGVGRGFLRAYVDSSGYPLAFQFTETDGVHNDTMAIGRPISF